MSAPHQILFSGFGGAAAFPEIASVTTGGSGANISTFPIDLPSSIAAGDLLIAAAATNGGPPSFTWPAGWTQFVDGNADDPIFSVAYRIANGSEGSTVDLTVNGSSRRGNWFCARITGNHASAAPEASSIATGTTSPDPPSLSPSWGSAKTLWLAVGATDSSGATVSAWPSGYGIEQTNSNSGTGSGTGTVFMAAKQAEAASDNPSAFTTSGGNSVAVTLGVRPI